MEQTASSDFHSTQSWEDLGRKVVEVTRSEINPHAVHRVLKEAFKQLANMSLPPMTVAISAAYEAAYLAKSLHGQQD